MGIEWAGVVGFFILKLFLKKYYLLAAGWLLAGSNILRCLVVFSVVFYNFFAACHPPATADLWHAVRPSSVLFILIIYKKK